MRLILRKFWRNNFKKPESTSFSGIKSKTKYEPKIEYKWRCTKCIVLNPMKNQEWKKWGQSRDLTPEETKIKEKEDIEFYEPKQTIVQILNDLENNLLLKELKACLTNISLICSNIIENPSEAKFRCIKLENKKFYESVGQHTDAIEIMILAGFELKDSTGEEGKMVLNYTQEIPSTMLKYTWNKVKDYIEMIKEEEETKGE